MRSESPLAGVYVCRARSIGIVNGSLMGFEAFSWPLCRCAEGSVAGMRSRSAWCIFVYTRSPQAEAESKAEALKRIEQSTLNNFFFKNREEGGRKEGDDGSCDPWCENKRRLESSYWFQQLWYGNFPPNQKPQRSVNESTETSLLECDVYVCTYVCMYVCIFIFLFLFICWFVDLLICLFCSPVYHSRYQIICSWRLGLLGNATESHLCVLPRKNHRLLDRDEAGTWLLTYIGPLLFVGGWMDRWIETRHEKLGCTDLRVPNVMEIF